MNAIEHVLFGLIGIVAHVMRYGAWLAMPLYLFVGYMESRNVAVAIYCGVGAFVAWRWLSRGLVQLSALVAGTR